MSPLKIKLGLLVAAGLMLSGCMQTTTQFQAAPEASLKPNDKAQLAKARYAKVQPAARKRRVPSSSIPTTTTSISSRTAARRSATA
jgi:PBP1b-binding outer membrane lipoprotein LpoB